MTEALEATLRRALSRPAAASSDFDLDPGARPFRAAVTLRPAGVLVPVWLRPGGAVVILTKRSSHLKHHPGQIALPGGKVGVGDANPESAALRETKEEIALPPAAVSVVGALPVHETVTGFAVTPFVGLIHRPFTPRPEAGEVEEVFTVPLAHVLDPTAYSVQSRFWMGSARHYYAVPYGPHYIWGATARILRGLAERVRECG